MNPTSKIFIALFLIFSLVVLSGSLYAKKRGAELTMSEVEISVGKRGSLRSIPASLKDSEVKSMLKRRGFFDSRWNKSGGFENEYESRIINGDKVVLDHAAGLMWHQSGSKRYMKYGKAKQWVDELNRRGYAACSDWRLPTLEEGASLVERSKMNGDLYINPKFSAKHEWIWTSDTVTGNPGRMWVVHFHFGGGGVRRGAVGCRCYVRPVRSVQK